MINFDIVLIAVEVVLSLLLIIPTKLSDKLVSTRWRILYTVPLIVCMVIAGFGGFEKLMIPVYIGSFIPLARFFRDSEKLGVCTSAANVVCCVTAVVLCIGNPAYRASEYTKEFDELFETMKKHYVLAEYKGIDWDRLYDKYRPKFKEADKADSDILNYTAWWQFCAEFHDGHVSYISSDINSEKDLYDINSKVFDQLGAGDYGLSLMRLADGRTVAVNVADTGAAADSGIYNGTIITSWDGKIIEKAAENFTAVSPYNFADKDNKDFYKALNASLSGGDTVKVTYLDETGTEKYAELSRIGNGYQRYKKTKDIIDQGTKAANLGWVEQNNDTVCLCIKSMQYDSDSEKLQNFDGMKLEIISKLDEYKEKGFKNVVIDLRNNGGGSGQLVKALGEIFAPSGTHYYCSDGLWDKDKHVYVYEPQTDRYSKGEDYYFTGEDRWEGNPVVILVNANSVSAADHLAMIMKDMNNITIMGFTEPNGSAQGIGSAISGKGCLSFSNALILDKDGNVFVDSGKDYESGDDIDIKIPFDEDAVRVLFDKHGDYAMQKVLEYLKEK